jgi:hypothetical protein
MPCRRLAAGGEAKFEQKHEHTLAEEPKDEGPSQTGLDAFLIYMLLI